ncbi:hypothetical protein ACXIZN_41055 [Amycolatopsis sp. TRM77291]
MASSPGSVLRGRPDTPASDRLAGIGVAAQCVTSWSSDTERSQADLLAVLDDIVWKRRTEIWDGVAGRRTAARGNHLRRGKGLRRPRRRRDLGLDVRGLGCLAG